MISRSTQNTPLIPISKSSPLLSPNTLPPSELIPPQLFPVAAPESELKAEEPEALDRVRGRKGSAANDSADLVEARKRAEAAMSRMNKISDFIVVAEVGASILAQLGGIVGASIIKNCVGVISDIWDSVVVSDPRPEASRVVEESI
jgi:hypothetical protein